MAEFLHDLNIHGAGQIQFKTTAGANAGKIDQDGNNLVLTNAVGDVLLGDGSSDVYIGDGSNNVDIIFEQSGSIKGDGSAVTLTLGGANTTLNLENPNFSGNIGMSSKLTFTTANGFILFDYEPSGDTGEYTTEVPLLKVGLGSADSTILARLSEYRAVALGADDTVWLRAGDTGSVIKSNVNLSAEQVVMSAEGGFVAYGFPSNDTTWSNRNEFKFYSADGTASNNGLYIGDGGSTQFIDVNRNLKNIGTIGSGAITSTGTITTDRLSIFTSNTDRATIQAGSSGTTGHLYLNSYEGSDLHQLTWSGANNGFYPQGSSGTFSLGLNGNRWSNVYTEALTASGEVEGGSLDINGNADFAGIISTTAGGSLLRKTESSWSNATTHDLIYQSWNTNTDDYIYLKTPGNSTTNHGIVFIGDNVIALGRTDVENGAPELTSAAAPISENWFVLNNTGATFAGTISSGKHTITKSSSHTAQGSFNATNAHLDLYNSLEANTDQKGSIITFTDNYYGGGSYNKTTRAAIKGGTDTVGNTADGYLEFYTDSGSANTPTLALRLDKNQNATFAGEVEAASLDINGNADISGVLYGNTVVIDNTTGTRGIFRDNAAYDLRLGGGTVYSDGAYISLSGGTRGGGTTNTKGRVEMYSGGSNYSAQADITGDIVIGTQWNGGFSDILTLDSSTDKATFAGDIYLSGGNIYNSTGSLVIQNDAGAQLDIKSNQGVRLYIDKNNDDTTRNFEILANTDTYNANNVVATVSQLGNATFTGTVTANGTTLTGDQDLSGFLTSSSTDLDSRYFTETEVNDRFTRKFTFDPGSGSGNRRYMRLFTVANFDASVVGKLSSAGDYGDSDRATYEIQIATRNNISFDVYQLSTDTVSDDYEFFYKTVGSTYEIWCRFGDYNKSQTFTRFSDYGTVTYNFDSSTQSTPSGLTAVTKSHIYHEGHKPTLSELGFTGDADATNDQDLSGLAPKASPTFTGVPAAPTAAAATNTAQIATTAFVNTAVSNLVDSAPGTLNTLNELAAALGDDENFSTTITNSIGAKLPLAGGTITGNLNVNSNLNFSGGTQKKIILGSQKAYVLPAIGTRMRILTLANHTSCRVYIDSSENSYNQPIVLDIFYNNQSSAKPVMHRTNNKQWHAHSNDIRFTSDTSGHIYAEKVAFTTGRTVNIRKVEEFKGTVTILDGSTTNTGGGANEVYEASFATLSAAGKITGAELEGTSLDINGAANIDGLLDVNTGTANTVAIFESTDDKAFIRIKDDDTDTHLISRNNSFSIGESSTDYSNFRVNITNGNTEAAGTFTAIGKITGAELEGTSLDINGNADINGNLVISGTVDGVDIAARDGVLTTTTNTANAAAPKASPTFTGNIIVPNKIIHSGDTDTYMQFEAADVWRVVTGGTERLDINTNRILVGDGMMMQYDGISTSNSGTVVKGGFLNPASEANMVHIPHIVNDLAGFNKWSNATITTSGFYASRSGSSGSYTYSNEIASNNSGWANAFDAHSSTAGSWYSDNGSDGIYQHGTDTPGIVELEWTNEATYSLWAGIVFGAGSFTPTYVKIEAYRADAWQTLCEITDNTDQVILRQVNSNSGTNAATRRLKYTLGGSVNNSYFRIHSLYMANYAAGNNNLNNTGTATTRGVNFLERYKDGYLHGFLRAGADNTYDLGHSSYRWKNIVGVNLHGDLVGTINTNTTAATQSTSDNSTKVATTAFVKNQGYGTSNLAIGSGSDEAMAGNTSLLQLGTTSTTALAGDTTIPTLSSLGGLPNSGGTISGDLEVTGKITQSGIVDFERYGRTYGVNVNAPLPILTHGGNALPTGGAYRVTGHISGTGTEQVSMAVFWNENGTWNINKTFEGGTSSNHVEFKLLDHGSGSVPTVTLETHTSNYNVHVYHERLSLEEGSGTDNLRGYFGADSYLSWLESTNTLTVPGTVAASNLSGTNTGDQTLPTAISLGAVTLTGTQTISGYKTFTNNGNTYNGHLYYTAYDAAGNHYPHFLDGSGNGGTTINWRQYYGTNFKTHTWTSDSSGNMLFTYQGGITATGALTGASLDINGNGDISGNANIGGTLTTGDITGAELESKHATAPVLKLRREDTSIVDGNSIGSILFQGDDPSATNTGAAIKGVAAGTWTMGSPNVYPSGLIFQTAKQATLLTALTLNEDQNATFTGDVTVGGGLVFQSADGATCTPVDFLSYTCPDSSGTTVNAKIGEGEVIFPDNSKVSFGNSSDLQIYHDASDSYIKDGGTGNLKILGANVEITTVGGNKYFSGASNVARLFHTNNEKLRTTSTGIAVTGNIAVTGTTDGVDLSEYPALPNQLTYQTLVAHFSQTSGSTSAFNIPMNNTTESTTATYYHSWTAPFDGQVKTMIMKHSHGTSPDLISSAPTKFGVAVNGTNADYISSSFLTRVRVEGRNDDYYSYIKDDNINESFSAGDRVYFQFINSSTSVRWRNCSVSIVVEYNIT